MMISTGEEVEVRKYKRLTELKIEVIFTISAQGTSFIWKPEEVH